MIGPLLGAGVSLAGILGQQQTARQANAINWRALMEQERMNRFNRQLATAPREDAYGNVINYTPGGGFDYDLTEATSRVLSGEQKERLANLLEDAPRDRMAAERMDRRSQMADDEFERLFNEYRFRPRETEDSFIADATQDALNSRRRGLDEAASLLSRQLLRTGGSSDLGRVFNMADEAYADSLGEVISGAKRQGRSDYQASQQNDPRLAELGFYKQIADTTENNPAQFSDFNNQLSGRADNALQHLTSVIANNRDSSANAYARYAQGVGNSAPDLSGLASILMRLGGEVDQQNAQEEKSLSQYDPWAGLRTVGATYSGGF